MTRNAIPFWTYLTFAVTGLFASTLVFATADSPVVQGLGGAGRAGGVPGEALFSNPAAVAMLTQSGAFLYYQKPRIPEWNAGGRMYAAGIYDGGNPVAKGSTGFVRTSRARLGPGNTQVYEDRSEYRLAIGSQLWANVNGGLGARYVTRRTGSAEKKFFDGDLGAIFPVYAGMIGGVTYENILNQAGEAPPTAAVGLTYGLGYGIQAYGDGYRFMKGSLKGNRGWALGAEVAVAGSFRLRGGRFQEGLRRTKGWSVGLSWIGPRASFDYAMRTSGGGPKERDHIIGMTIAL